MSDKILDQKSRPKNIQESITGLISAAIGWYIVKSII